jgi:hypothetical protein
VGQPGGSSYWGRATRKTGRYTLPSERTYLLPYTVDHQTVVRYGAVATSKRRSSRLLHVLGAFISCILLLALICGLCYGIYRGVEVLVAFGTQKLWPILISIWDKVVDWLNRLSHPAM